MVPMRNLFVINGFIPAIITRSLIEGRYRDDENYIVLDVARSLIRQDNLRDAGSDLVRLLELFLDGIPALRRTTIVHARSYVTLARHPFRYIAEAKRLCSTVRAALHDFPKRFDRVIYSGNSRVQDAIALGSARRILIEHGLGDYDLSGKDAPRTRRHLKSFVLRLLGAAIETQPDERFLLDGGRALSTTPDIPDKVMRLPTPDVSSQAEIFLGQLRDVLPQLHEEVCAIVERLRQAPSVFVSLPPEMLAEADLPAYFNELKTMLQQRGFDVAGSCFLVKPHPTDFRDYRTLYSPLGVGDVMLLSPAAKFIPAEFFLAWIPAAVLIGVGSTSLFYSWWWLGRPPIYFGSSLAEAEPTYRVLTRAFARDIAVFPQVRRLPSGQQGKARESPRRL
jgi:hypothetical protein